MSKKCLYCYQTLSGETDFHESCSQKFFGSKTAPLIPYSLEQMEELAQNIVERSIAVPGVQPKLSMRFDGGTDKRLTVVGALSGDYIFKPPSADFKEMPANEHLTMRIAEAYSINVVPSSLIRLKSGELSDITKRIDRTSEDSKIHMLDMFQITDAFDKYKSSMEKVGKALGEYSSNPLLDKLFLFELTLFCYLTGNNDMHLKNFSMILSNDLWKLAPAYDLLNVGIVIPDDDEELALTLNGKKKKLNKASFDKFGDNLGLNEKQLIGVYNRFAKNKKKADKLIEASFLSDGMKESYTSLMNIRYDNILSGY